VRRGRPPYPDVLTPREQEVLALIREGLTNEQIGARLGISEHGAKYHVAEILSKLGVSSRQEAARWSQPERVAPGLVGLLTRHAAVGALVVAGVGLLSLAAGVLLMNERSGGATTGGQQAQQQEETLPPPPGVDDGPIRRIAYVEMRGEEEGDIWTMNPDGSDKVQLTDDPGWEGAPSWSPEGRRIAFESRPNGASGDGRSALFVMNSDGSSRRQILDDTGGAGLLVWSPDGKKIAFHSSLIGNLNVFVVDSDGGNFKALTNDKRINAGLSWTLDSKRIAFSNGAGIAAIDADGTNAALVYPLDRNAGVNAGLTSDLTKAIVRTEVDRQNGLYDIDVHDLRTGAKTRLATAARGIHGFVWSPDGSQLAYAQEETPDVWSIKVVGADGTNARTLLTITDKSTTLPKLSLVGASNWTSDGRYLVYSRTYTVARFESEGQTCYISIDMSDEGCLPTNFPGTGGIDSSSLLLN
jgi:Tol biopolymer transport system component/DNA-binding CsgD family transcriptional regulator